MQTRPQFTCTLGPQADGIVGKIAFADLRQSNDSGNVKSAIFWLQLGPTCSSRFPAPDCAFGPYSDRPGLDTVQDRFPLIALEATLVVSRLPERREVTSCCSLLFSGYGTESGPNVATCVSWPDKEVNGMAS